LKRNPLSNEGGFKRKLLSKVSRLQTQAAFERKPPSNASRFKRKPPSNEGALTMQAASRASRLQAQAAFERKPLQAKAAFK
jgi:hypothetical protein